MRPESRGLTRRPRLKKSPQRQNRAKRKRKGWRRSFKTFSVALCNQADILEQLLQLYFPDGAKIIDLTYGTGAFFWNIFEKPRLNEIYQVTKCDAEPSLEGEEIHKLDLETDDYSQLGLHDCAVFDPPYLIGRPSFDYPASSKVLDSNISGTQVLAMQFQGKRSWSAKARAKTGENGINRFVANMTLEVFHERLKGLARVAPTVLKDNGLLLTKIMNPRHKGKLVDHAFAIKREMHESFDLVDELAYVRQGATTWKIKGHLQNLHGYWLVFQKRAISSK